MDLLNAITYDGKFNIPPTFVSGEMKSMSRKFDCSNTNLAAATAYDIFKLGDANNANNGFRVIEVVTEVVTAEGDAGTLDIGDEDSGTRFETDANINATGITVSSDALITYASLKKITMTPSIALDTAVFIVTVRYEMLDLTATT